MGTLRTGCDPLMIVPTVPLLPFARSVCICLASFVSVVVVVFALCILNWKHISANKAPVARWLDLAFINIL